MIWTHSERGCVSRATELKERLHSDVITGVECREYKNLITCSIRRASHLSKGIRLQKSPSPTFCCPPHKRIGTGQEFLHTGTPTLGPLHTGTPTLGPLHWDPYTGTPTLGPLHWDPYTGTPTLGPLHRDPYTGTTTPGPLHRDPYTGTPTPGPLHWDPYTGTPTPGPLHWDPYTGTPTCV